ncbi:hypothetical protein KIPB_003647 [Kipferlia bialata]|uniref:N-acetyltransferase domain-containing protein n=1 Tax=Kipferlia bialata TaxID=797122 RepID=A0A9K3CUS6_9EUKA|nr:hypothetical protein KIPB_003647 [Kipferlia bialata]|eukprot:g3647.t1
MQESVVESGSASTRLDIGVPGYYLRGLRHTDAEAIARHANNPSIAANLRDMFPHPYTLDDAITFLGYSVQEGFDLPPLLGIVYEGERGEGEEVVGCVGLTLGKDVERYSAELGYWLSEQHWGKGVVTGAVKAIVQHAFSTLGLLRVFAEPYSHNRASCKVLEKSGFQCEGLLRASSVKSGVVIDQYMYAIVNEDLIQRWNVKE